MTRHIPENNWAFIASISGNTIPPRDPNDDDEDEEEEDEDEDDDEEPPIVREPDE